MADLLARNDDGSLNYDVRAITSSDETVTRARLRELWLELFGDDFAGDALFYFSGHGAQTPWGGYLATQDGAQGELGVSMEDLLLLANRSKAREVVLMLDCCHSGDLGDPPILQGLQEPLTLLREGVTVLAASRPNEVSYEREGYGVFTDALAEGLAGGAADHLGNVSPASLFVYADRLFGAWDQRPVYKTHAAEVSVLRVCHPPVSGDVLRSITELFPKADDELNLDPEYESEPEDGEEDPDRAKKRDNAWRLKRLRDARLVESPSGDDLYWSAMDSKPVRLTALGRYYWRLVDADKI